MLLTESALPITMSTRAIICDSIYKFREITMGLFDKKEVSTSNIVDESYVERLRQEYNEYLGKIDKIKTVAVSVEGKQFDAATTYAFCENDSSYIFYPMRIGKGLIVYDAEIYKQALSMPTIQLAKAEYTCELMQVKEKEEIINIYTKKYVVGSVKILFQKQDDQIEVEINGSQPDYEPIKELISSLEIKNLYNIIDVPKDCFVIKVSGGKEILQNEKYVFWRNENCLYFAKSYSSVTDKQTIFLTEIPIEKILYYKEEGSLRYEQEISGGGGMGINYTGAVIGGLLFGTAGALIGSRNGQEIKEIKSETKAVDTRIVILKIYDEDNNISNLIFDCNTVNAFEWYIPEKEYRHVIEKRRDTYEL